MAIRSFACSRLQHFFETGVVERRAGWVSVAKVVARKLDMLDYAAVLQDLERPSANRLEALKGDRKGYHSIRVNDRWRVVFRWTPSGPVDVDVVDYH